MGKAGASPEVRSTVAGYEAVSRPSRGACLARGPNAGPDGATGRVPCVFPPPQRERATPPALQIHRIILESALFHVSLLLPVSRFCGLG